MRRLKLETIQFSEVDGISDLRLCDFFFHIKQEFTLKEKPLIEQDIFKPPDTFFQGKKSYQAKYNHGQSAPELLPPINMIESKDRHYTTQADLWTAGCLIYNMITGVPPFLEQ
jgi:serine/threonine protein kinase